MSISGDLQDVSVAEVMQFIHLGRRTGTLNIRRGDQQAAIGFHRGRIVSAWTPQSKRLGELLLEGGTIEPSVLQETLRHQAARHPRPSLGKLLVTSGKLTADDLRKVVGRQIEETVYELVTWKDGSFDFALDELRPIDDVGVYPGDLLPDINLNTQMVVLDGLRIFDERNRRRPPIQEKPLSRELPANRVTEEIRKEDELSDLFDAEPEVRSGTEEPHQPPPIRFQILSEDQGLLRLLLNSVPDDLAQLTPIEFADAGLTLPGEPPPVVLIDLRSETSLDHLEFVARSRPRASVLAVVDPWVAPAGAYEAGALAVLPPDAKAITACLISLLRARAGNAAQSLGPHSVSSGFARLRRVVADLRSGLLSATVALNLMQVISESVERAIMLLVREDHLVALGAFGSRADGQPLARTTHGLRIPLDRGGALTDAVDYGQTRSMLFDEARMPETLITAVGRPRTGQVVIFPVLGTARVISVVYADNGELGREIEEIEILELAAAQVGVAFENEILRRRIERELLGRTTGAEPDGQG